MFPKQFGMALKKSNLRTFQLFRSFWFQIKMGCIASTMETSSCCADKEVRRTCSNKTFNSRQLAEKAKETHIQKLGLTSKQM